MKLRFTSICVALVVAAFASPAWAVPITFSFTGTVDGLYDDAGYLDDSIVPGETFTGTYTFESSTPDDSPDVPWATYGFASSPELVMTLRIGSYDIVAPLAFIYVENTTKDVYQVQSQPFSIGSKSALLNFTCMDVTHTAFSTDALPLNPPDVLSFEYTGFSFGSTDQFGDGFGVGGLITSITPEPASAICCVMGLLLVSRRKN